MSTTRQLPQRPGQTPPDGREFVYPPYPRPQAPYERHASYPIPQSPGMYGPINHPHPPSSHERSYFQHPSDTHSRPYSMPPGYLEQNGHGGGAEQNGDGKKKRPRELSLSGKEADQQSPPARPSTSKASKPDSGSDGKAAPSVLIREKKQVSNLSLDGSLDGTAS